MALTTTNLHMPTFSASIFQTIGRFLVKIAENSDTAKRLEALSMMSDADLVARGVTREEMVERFVRTRCYV
ncbi:hypothetical protein [Actibacterium sp.]|uniref:hypothetical protein n=1 Tax=Actibacterium sp. TaxID=1872125 RepID=UPI003569028B